MTDIQMLAQVIRIIAAWGIIIATLLFTILIVLISIRIRMGDKTP